MQQLKNRDFSSEFEFKTSRSSGSGGQHVNKTESRVTLFFHLMESALLSEDEKTRLKQSWSNRLNRDYVLKIDVETSRSQLKNKKLAIERFYELLLEGLRKKKKRKATKPTKAAIKKRMKLKKQQAEKKQNRRKDNLI